MLQKAWTCSDQLLRLARELIQIPTVAGREYRIMDYLAAELQRAGCSVSWQTVLGAGGHNLIASRGEGGPWFVTHVDVYPTYDHPDPFKPQMEDSKAIVGRGAVDTKGQIAGLLYSLQQTSGPVQVSFVVDEERLARGSEALEVPPEVNGAIILEPTELKIAVAEAGSMGLEVNVTGKAAHGAMPWMGKSAVELAFSQYQRLRTKPFIHHYHPLFSPGGWVNLGRISGGHDTMLVPPRCLMEMEVGFAPGISAHQVTDQIYEALSEAESVHIEDIWDPWETDSEEEVVLSLQRAFQEAVGFEAELWGVPSWTDGANVVRKGIPTVVFGAGSLAVAHTWHESLPLDQLEGLYRILTRLIETWPEEEGR